MEAHQAHKQMEDARGQTEPAPSTQLTGGSHGGPEKCYMRAGLLVQDGETPVQLGTGHSAALELVGVNGKKWPVVLPHPVDQEAKKDIYLFVTLHSRGN